MYKFLIKGIENTNQYEELIKVFLTQDEYRIVSPQEMQSAEFQENLQSAENYVFKEFIYGGDKDKE